MDVGIQCYNKNCTTIVTDCCQPTDNDSLCFDAYLCVYVLKNALDRPVLFDEVHGPLGSNATNGVAIITAK